MTRFFYKNTIGYQKNAISKIKLSYSTSGSIVTTVWLSGIERYICGC
jgi:hypothetical protein